MNSNTSTQATGLTPYRIIGIMVALVLGLSPAQAARSQGVDPTRAELAALREDVALMRQEIAQLRLEVERLAHENAQLKRSSLTAQEAQAANQAGYVTLAQLNEEVIALRNEMRVAAARQKSEIITQVSEQMERLATQTESAMTALAKSVEAQPQVVSSFEFSPDYPKNGVAYTVKSGDTLSKIAKELNSTVRDIQNANKIADPKDLQAGQTIFVPQAK